LDRGLARALAATPGREILGIWPITTVTSENIWALLLYVALAAGMYATMARAFGWL